MLLDQLWQWLAGIDARPTGTAARGAENLNRELEDAESTGLREKVMISFAGLGMAVDEPPDEAALRDSAKAAVEVIVEFLEGNAATAEHGRLLDAEMRHQRGDLEILKGDTDLTAVVGRLRSRAEQAPLLAFVDVA